MSNIFFQTVSCIWSRSSSSLTTFDYLIRSCNLQLYIDSLVSSFSLYYFWFVYCPVVCLKISMIIRQIKIGAIWRTPNLCGPDTRFTHALLGWGCTIIKKEPKKKATGTLYTLEPHNPHRPKTTHKPHTSTTISLTLYTCTSKHLGQGFSSHKGPSHRLWFLTTPTPLSALTIAQPIQPKTFRLI